MKTPSQDGVIRQALTEAVTRERPTLALAMTSDAGVMAIEQVTASDGRLL